MDPCGDARDRHEDRHAAPAVCRSRRVCRSRLPQLGRRQPVRRVRRRGDLPRHPHPHHRRRQRHDRAGPGRRRLPGILVRLGRNSDRGRHGARCVGGPLCRSRNAGDATDLAAGPDQAAVQHGQRCGRCHRCGHHRLLPRNAPARRRTVRPTLVATSPGRARSRPDRLRDH